MPPRPADVSPRPPGDFAALLASEEPVLLVGGQAVNLWALYYDKRTAPLAPFVSRDVDVLGDRETLAALGKLAGVKPQFFPLKPPTNEIGVVIAQDAVGQPLLIEVLRSVHGVTNAALRDPVYTLAVGTTHVQVPGPIALMQAKLANVADLAQSGRQDARHVTILAHVLPAYLEDLQVAVLAGRTPERKLIELVEQLLAVVTTAKARRVLRALQIDPPALFAGLGHTKLPKLRKFLTERLPRRLA
ncbi:MAG TPA: hypothetical protein DCQ94_09140 [Nitrospira sp.]|nr:hypothetical protein [Nitrospira sp.]HRI81434.1 hypothetical protein [Opitutaceae bacterium]HRJ46062.1 hypothetical protein [Opitutaceae bacterium]